MALCALWIFILLSSGFIERYVFVLHLFQSTIYAAAIVLIAHWHADGTAPVGKGGNIRALLTALCTVRRAPRRSRRQGPSACFSASPYLVSDAPDPREV